MKNPEELQSQLLSFDTYLLIIIIEGDCMLNFFIHVLIYILFTKYIGKNSVFED